MLTLATICHVGDTRYLSVTMRSRAVVGLMLPKFVSVANAAALFSPWSVRRIESVSQFATRSCPSPFAVSKHCMPKEQQEEAGASYRIRLLFGGLGHQLKLAPAGLRD